MIIKFSYYNDEDFGLTAFSEIEFSQKRIYKILGNWDYGGLSL